MESSEKPQSPVVTQPNQIIRAHYDLKLVQKRIILMALCQLDTKSETTKNDVLIIDIQDFYKQSNTKFRMGEFIKRTKKEVIDLTKQTLSVDIGETQRKIYPWLSTCEYNTETTKIELTLNTAVAELFSNLTGNFTQHFLDNSFQLKSKYSMRLYEILLQQKPDFKENQTFEIEELRQLLGLKKSKEENALYPEYKHLKQKVIDLILNDINQHTDINIKYAVEKKGRNVTHLVFNYEFKTDELKQLYKKLAKDIKQTEERLYNRPSNFGQRVAHLTQEEINAQKSETKGKTTQINYMEFAKQNNKMF